MFGQKKPLDEPVVQPQPEAQDASSASSSEEMATQAPSREVELEQEVASLKDALIRQMAEADNYRKRMEREMDDSRKFAVSSFAKDMLPIADNFSRAMAAIPADLKENNPAVKNLMVGVEATERQMLAVFEKAGIQQIKAMGQMFDPNFHQAMQEVEDITVAAGTIVQVFQQGFTIAGRLLRPALVVVAKGSTAAGGQVNTEA